MKIFLKKYWWIVLPLPLIILYWLNKSSTAPTSYAASAQNHFTLSVSNNPGVGFVIYSSSTGDTNQVSYVIFEKN